MRRGPRGARREEDLFGLEALGPQRGGSETTVGGEEGVKVAEEGVDFGRLVRGELEGGRERKLRDCHGLGDDVLRVPVSALDE